MVGVRSTDRNEELSQDHKNVSEAKGGFLYYLHLLHVDVDNTIQSWGADVCGYPQPTDYTQPRGCILLSEADKGGVNPEIIRIDISTQRVPKTGQQCP